MIVVVGALEGGEVDEHRGGRGLTGERVDHGPMVPAAPTLSAYGLRAQRKPMPAPWLGKPKPSL